jgi:hypothetical protein|mmetsp:Transcript_83283/g.131464  ORF Transcript_83283/g.131464 Transcript_83283/m.131464 type:complete len:392 (-) Transcript_83283:69-1244(-)
MACGFTKTSLCVTLALLSAIAGEARTNLRPYIARRHHALSNAARTNKPVPPAPAAFVDAKSEQSDVAKLSAVDHSDASTPRPALTQLTDELAEVKQLHANVVTAEQALGADVTLLRESAMLERVATSSADRAAGHRQVIEAEKIVKEAEVLVKESRESAVARASDALREANDVRKAADELTTEAMGLLKGKVRGKSFEVAAPSQPNVPSKPSAAQEHKIAKVQPRQQVKPNKLRTVKTAVSAPSEHALKAKQTKLQAHVEKQKPAQIKHLVRLPQPAHAQKKIAAKVESVAQKKHASSAQPSVVLKKAPTQTKQPPHAQKKVSAPVMTKAPLGQKKVPAHVQVNASVVHTDPKVAPPTQVPTITVDDSEGDSDSDDVGPSSDGANEEDASM